MLSRPLTTTAAGGNSHGLPSEDNPSNPYSSSLLARSSRSMQSSNTRVEATFCSGSTIQGGRRGHWSPGGTFEGGVGVFTSGKNVSSEQHSYVPPVANRSQRHCYQVLTRGGQQQAKIKPCGHAAAPKPRINFDPAGDRGGCNDKARRGFQMFVLASNLRQPAIKYQLSCTRSCTPTFPLPDLPGQTRDHGITRRVFTTFAMLSPVKWVSRLPARRTFVVRGSFHTPSGTAPERGRTNGERPSIST